METVGRLTIKMFVASHAPDNHGRTRGSWRTLLSRYLDRDDIDETLMGFMEANPQLRRETHHLMAQFVTEETIKL